MNSNHPQLRLRLRLPLPLQTKTISFMIFAVLQSYLFTFCNGQACEQICMDVCPNACHSIEEQGYCDLSLGQCVCSGNWGGDDCGTVNGPDPLPAAGNPLDISALPEKIDAFEEAVKILGENVEELFSQAGGATRTDWYDYCDDAYPKDSVCDPEFGNFEECDCSGRLVSESEIGMRTPDYLDCRMEAANLVAGALHPLLEVYQELSATYPDISLQYFGSDDGIFHSHPADRAADDEECPIYDPRRRPWYIAASSGPKRVVLIIDRSGSMSDESRLEKAREAAISVIDGLSFDDYFGIVVFESLSSKYKSQLEEATSANKEKAIDWIGDVSSSGGTDFYRGFEDAFELLDECAGSCENACRSAILFLTDGENGGQNPKSLVKDWMNDNSDADLFTFTLGDGASKDLPRELAEDNDGLYKHIPDGGDLLSSMSSYYQYYAIGIADGANEVVRWSEPYEDFSGLGPMITAGMPVYDRSENPPVFLGVVAMDLQACDLYEAYAASDIFDVLKERGGICIEWSLTASDIEAIQERQRAACSDAVTLLESGTIGEKLRFILRGGLIGLITLSLWP